MLKCLKLPFFALTEDWTPTKYTPRESLKKVYF